MGDMGLGKFHFITINSALGLIIDGSEYHLSAGLHLYSYYYANFTSDLLFYFTISLILRHLTIT